MKRINKGVLLLCCVGMFACGRDKAFTLEERQRIGEKQEGIMSVYTIDKQSDSLFLRKKAKALSKKETESEYFQVLKHRMLLTVMDTTNPGVGIAAPQVGISRQVIAVQRFDRAEEPFEFYVNPQIVFSSSRRILGPEGCLSVPERRDSVWRSEEIVVRYADMAALETVETGLPWKEETIRGFTAVIFQHEIDHLNGVLFMDRLESRK